MAKDIDGHHASCIMCQVTVSSVGTRYVDCQCNFAEKLMCTLSVKHFFISASQRRPHASPVESGSSATRCPESRVPTPEPLVVYFLFTEHYKAAVRVSPRPAEDLLHAVVRNNSYSSHVVVIETATRLQNNFFFLVHLDVITQ